MGSSYAVNKWSSRYITEVHISSVEGENDAIWKRWRHQNRHDRVPHHSTVSIQNGGQTLPCGFPLDQNDFQSFDALSSAFNPAEALLRFHKKETRYLKASDLASVGKSSLDARLLFSVLVALQLFLASFRRKISKNSKPQQHPTTKNQEWRQSRGPVYWNAHASSSFENAHWGYKSVFKTDTAL